MGKLTPVKAIRAKCLDCCCGQMAEVRLCPSKECNLTSAVRIELALLKEPLIQAQAKDNQRGSGGAVVQKSSEPPIKTRERVAELALLKEPLIQEQMRENQKGRQGGVLLPKISAEAT